MAGKLLSIVAILLLCSQACAITHGFCYLEATKTVNGDTVYRLPSLEMTITDKNSPILIDYELAGIFTSKRGASFFPNHHSVRTALHMGVHRDKCFATFSIGADWVFPENDDKIAPGLYGNNSVRVGIAF